MKRLLFALVTAIAASAAASAAQDTSWLRAWETAQKEKPSRLTSSERIAPASEPGTPFVMRGTITDPGGKPAAGVEVFAYQTDSTGLYAKDGGAYPWRLRGWAVSDSQGRFEFKTIRPAAYPNRDIPGHIHLSFVTGCCGRQTSEVMFDDDPLATAQFRQRNPAVMFGKITRRGDGAQETSYVFKLKSNGEF
jgi:protocatechuate 3,4-dioxygenase beta subunit